MEILICPKCGEALYRDGKTYKCTNSHSYDVSKRGYVNLLLSNQSSKKRHGDDKLMVAARRDFLDRGFYSPLRDALGDILADSFSGSLTLLDAGCGEGWYLEGILDRLDRQGTVTDAYGIDISKDAVTAACKRLGGRCTAAVAGVFDMPVADGSCDAVLNVFSPDAGGEYSRVLKKGGLLLRVVPLRGHLLSLKQAVYDNTYENDELTQPDEGFERAELRELKYSISLEGEEIENLFKMTPYYYKTSARDQKKLESIKTLETEICFGIVVCRKL